jgi:hypothetical protein
MYQEKVYQYRVMRQLNDAERNPEGSWSLVFSSMDEETALEVLLEEVQRWGKTGDAFKMKDSGRTLETISRQDW